MEKLLIIDDSEEIRSQLKWGLGREYSVIPARDRSEALTHFQKHQPRVVILDLGLPPHDDGTEEGFACLEGLLQQAPLTKIIVITGNSERASALQAVKKGAYDFYQKPIELDELRVIIRRAVHLAAIEEENLELHIAQEKNCTNLCGIVGQCPEMLQLFSTIKKVAPSDISVLIQGESGTGKELVARAIHSMSPRQNGPLVVINCGAIPESLLESELFGHEKGAFTGAHAQVPGRFECAKGGTLFLDEIGELPAQLQVKVLRFLQDRTVQRIGGRTDISIDARIIAATNKDLLAEVRQGRFREDLYYRIGIVTVPLPPLRERSGDIVLLATLFLNRFNREYGKKVKGFSAQSVRLMETYAWPGNIRELEKRVQGAVILSESAMIEPSDLGLAAEAGHVDAPQLDGGGLKEARDKIEKEMVVVAIDKCRGNIARAAHELGISRPTLYDIMKKHGLSALQRHG